MTPANLSPINPGEVALAVVGVRAVISRAVEKITTDQRKAMTAYEKIIRQRAKALVADEVRCTWPTLPSYKPLLRDLTQPFDQQQVEAMIEPFDLDVQTAYLPLAGNAFAYLQNALPRSVSKSLAGFKQLPIDDPSFFRFAGILRVLDDPLQVFELAAGGALMRYQVQALREIYPTVSAAIDDAITQAVIDAKARDAGYELPMMAEQGVSVWLGLPLVTVPTGQVFAAANKTRDQQQRPSMAQLTPQAATALTAGQQVEFPKATA